jgi:hypothetical protein
VNWGTQPIHSFLGGYLNSCLQGTNTRVGSSQLGVCYAGLGCMHEKLVGAKRLEACCRASFMGFDDALYFVWNFSSIDLCLGVGFVV